MYFKESWKDSLRGMTSYVEPSRSGFTELGSIPGQDKNHECFGLLIRSKLLINV